MENKMTEIMQNEEAIAVVEKVAKFDLGKILKTGGKAVGIGLAGYGLFKVGQAAVAKVRSKKEKEATENESESFENAELA